MSPPRDKAPRRPLRWLSAIALLALAPKCLLCLAAYAGVGALLGVKLAGPEICGASAPGPGWPWIALAGAALGVVVFRRFSGSVKRQAGSPTSGDDQAPRLQLPR